MTHYNDMCPHFAVKFQPFHHLAEMNVEHTMNTRLPPPPSHPSVRGVAGAKTDPGKLRSVDVPTPTHTWRPHIHEEESMTHTCEEGADDAAAAAFTFLSSFRTYHARLLIRGKGATVVSFFFFYYLRNSKRFLIKKLYYNKWMAHHQPSEITKTILLNYN